MQEEWRVIEGFPEYEVSNLGRVKSLNYNHTKKEQILKPVVKQGYLAVLLFKDKKGFQFTIHRLVGKTFIENPDNLPCIDHIDRNRKNNFIQNLRWATYSTNQLNRTVSCKGTNTNQNHISYSSRDNSYCVQIMRNFIRYRKGFKTLEEAIEYRDAIQNLIPS